MTAKKKLSGVLTRNVSRSLLAIAAMVAVAWAADR